jgi:hypothetical protein
MKYVLLYEFVADDPFLVHGVLKSYEIRAWDEILTADRWPDAEARPCRRR